MTLNHVWMFLCLSAAAYAVTVLYPAIGSSESLTCECPDHQCQKMYWYRFQENKTLEYLMSCNSANTAVPAEGVNTSRFKASANEGSSKIVYTLRITGLQKSDAGLYSCILHGPKHDQKNLMPAGYFIRPGEPRPTLPPPTVKNPKKTKTRTCKPNNHSVKGCKPLVLWPCVGILLVLAVFLISTLYYFSRLPKKCRHQFAKKVQLK